MFEIPTFKRTLIEKLKTFFREDDIKIIAIDGTSGKEAKSEYVIFYSLAYAVEGTLRIGRENIKLTYSSFSSGENIKKKQQVSWHMSQSHFRN